MLSLSPRSDLFRFHLPKTFLPEELYKKWQRILSQDPGVFVNPIDYLNESIKSITLPGITDINIQQQQISRNKIKPSNRITENGHASLGKLNIEPKHDNTYVGSYNPLDKIENKLKVTFRLNQGLYNYFMLYETLFYRIGKPWLLTDIDTWEVEVLDENGVIASKIRFEQCLIDGIEGLEFNFTNTERQAQDFSCDFSFNNINMEFMGPREIPVQNK